MKPLLLTLLLATLCAATGYGQTIKSLGYNSTNGQIVANTGTNVLTFTNDVMFANGDLSFVGQVIAGTGVSFSFEDGAFTGTLYMDGGSIEFSTTTNASITRTNLSLGATWLTNTNVTNFRTEIGLGATNSVEFGSLNATNITSSGGINALYLSVEAGGSISFDDAFAADTTRTNLSLGLPALTNTNAATMLAALGGLATNGNASALTNLTATNFVGAVAVANGGTGATNAEQARTNLFGHGGVTTNISVVGTNNTNTLVFTNGILLEVTTP